MVPSHIPVIVSIFCSSIQCDNIPMLQDLIQTNIGPLLELPDTHPTHTKKNNVSCSRMHTDLIECDVYTPWKTSCAVCKQLKETFTPQELSNILIALNIRIAQNTPNIPNTSINTIEIDCKLPNRYQNCD